MAHCATSCTPVSSGCLRSWHPTIRRDSTKIAFFRRLSKFYKLYKVRRASSSGTRRVTQRMTRRVTLVDSIIHSVWFIRRIWFIPFHLIRRLRLRLRLEIWAASQCTWTPNWIPNWMPNWMCSTWAAGTRREPAGAEVPNTVFQTHALYLRAFVTNCDINRLIKAPDSSGSDCLPSTDKVWSKLMEADRRRTASNRSNQAEQRRLSDLQHFFGCDKPTVCPNWKSMNGAAASDIRVIITNRNSKKPNSRKPFNKCLLNYIERVWELRFENFLFESFFVRELC